MSDEMKKAILPSQTDLRKGHQPGTPLTEGHQPRGDGHEPAGRGHQPSAAPARPPVPAGLSSGARPAAKSGDGK